MEHPVEAVRTSKAVLQEQSDIILAEKRAFSVLAEFV